MINLHKVFGITLVFLLSGCGLSLPEFGSTGDSDINSADYEMVLNERYDGYSDDDELTSAEIDNGAEDFVKCSNATECSLLWDTAKEWLTKKSMRSKLLYWAQVRVLFHVLVTISDWE